VTSGRQVWLTYQEKCYLSPFIFAPGGNVLLVANESGEVLVYRCDDGTMLYRVSTGPREPIEALAFDHDATSLWLATETMLVRYHLSVDLTF
jgi:hypothetical protein